ncbi:MAG: hypothetical protein CME90_11105 [Hoeflea sp.]|nr:hypothetical protein [Hoeflea sp.]|tara:strand:+ start:12729 stop:12923 length:195 start_codon:yes stop_codon:yes gene_type:complete
MISFLGAVLVVLFLVGGLFVCLSMFAMNVLAEANRPVPRGGFPGLGWLIPAGVFALLLILAGFC